MIYLELIFVFFTIGLFTIGGGYAMIPMIRDQVLSREWMSLDTLMNFFAIAESTPGPFAVNTATLVGFQQAGVLGAVVATISVILPSFIIILVIAIFLHNFLKYKSVKAALSGIKPVVVGMILAVAFQLVIKNGFGGIYSFKSIDYIALIIMVIIFAFKMIYKKLSPILMIVISGILGLILYGFFPI